MWDAWAVYDDTAEPIFLKERIQADDVAAARHEAISYAAYRVLYRRYQISPGAYVSLPSFDDLLIELGYDNRVTEREGNSPAAVGNRIAKLILDQGYDDGADELGSYAFEFDYRPVNPPLVVANSGVGELADPNRWQPLSLRLFVDQAGRVQPGGVQRFIGSHWGSVTSFSLPGAGMAASEGVFHDPGPPPYLGGEGSDEYRHGFAEVLRYSTTLDPDDGVMMDILATLLRRQQPGGQRWGRLPGEPGYWKTLRAQPRQARRLGAGDCRVLGRRPRLGDPAGALEQPGQLRDRPPAAGAAHRRRGAGARFAGVGREAVPGLERGGARRRGLRLGVEGSLRTTCGRSPPSATWRDWDSPPTRSCPPTTRTVCRWSREWRS